MMIDHEHAMNDLPVDPSSIVQLKIPVPVGYQVRFYDQTGF